jgi:hypothetical protein
LNHVWFRSMPKCPRPAQCLSMPIRRITNLGRIPLRFSSYFGPSASEPSVVRAVCVCYFGHFFTAVGVKVDEKLDYLCSEMKGAERSGEGRAGAGRIDQVHFCRRSSPGGRQRRGVGDRYVHVSSCKSVKRLAESHPPVASAKCRQRQVAAGSIGTSHRSTTYEFLTRTTRVTFSAPSTSTRLVSSVSSRFLPPRRTAIASRVSPRLCTLPHFLLAACAVTDVSAITSRVNS